MNGYQALGQIRPLLLNKSYSREEILEKIKQTEWDFASKNEDDDFHTDILFIRTATQYMQAYIGDAHQKALLVYKGYCGEFYFEKKNTARISKKIIRKLIEHPRWREKFNDEIYQSASALMNVYEGIEKEQLKKMTLPQLKELYSNQMEAHLKLYEKCWPAEIIQVPEVGMTEYLLDYLMEKGKIDSQGAENIYYYLTRSMKDSVYVEEEKALMEIAEVLLKSGEMEEVKEAPIKYLRTYLSKDIIESIEKIIEKYGYLGYHGYGTRRPYSLEEYLKRIQEYVIYPEKMEKQKEIWGQNLILSEIECQIVGEIDETHHALFKIYGELAVSKAYRRLAQLKNFYYLDELLKQMALRLDLTESHLRFMLPEEIIKLCEGERSFLQNLQMAERRFGMVYLYENEAESIVLMNPEEVIEAIHLEEKGEEKLSVLTGRAACVGIRKGIAKVIERNSDMENFKDGDILVSLEADPDLIPIMRRAGAIVTDQGGITCHAAVIAREFNIPCVIGTIHATKCIQDGDILMVDAYKGEVTIER